LKKLIEIAKENQGVPIPDSLGLADHERVFLNIEGFGHDCL
jgi:hypothetical protein